MQKCIITLKNLDASRRHGWSE